MLVAENARARPIFQKPGFPQALCGFFNFTFLNQQDACDELHWWCLGGTVSIAQKS